MKEIEPIHKSATISECGRYRLNLVRQWAEGDVLPFIMLNPSTADADIDDPTIRRCMSFAKREGFGGIQVSNLYTLRSANPSDLWLADDPVGPEADQWLECAARVLNPAGIVVCAWGANARADRVQRAVDIIRPYAKMVCLGTTKDGHPRHPLYVKSDQPLIQWEPPCR